MRWQIGGGHAGVFTPDGGVTKNAAPMNMGQTGWTGLTPATICESDKRGLECLITTLERQTNYVILGVSRAADNTTE